MRVLSTLLILALTACTQTLSAPPLASDVGDDQSTPAVDGDDWVADGTEDSLDDTLEGEEEPADDVDDGVNEYLSDPMGLETPCRGDRVSSASVDVLLLLSDSSTVTDIYDVSARIDAIATIFETCGDPWGLFPTTSRQIPRRIIQAIETREIEDENWGRAIVLDFAGRYFDNLREALSNGRPSYAWDQYYYLADRSDVSRTRAVVVAMVAHLTLDLPYALVAVQSTDDHEDDYFVLGELMIEIADVFIEDLRYYYDTDPEDLLNGFFFGNWVDGAFGEDTTITLNYQTIRTKSWNNHRLLKQWWGGWIAAGEIYSAFWTMDGILATLDASGTI